MAEIKLKPCPFCGGKAEVQKFTSMYDCGFCVVCGTEDCQGNVEPENPYRSKKYAIAAWNTRAENIVHCKDCKHLMFSDCYGECRRGYLGIVSPEDFCSRGERRSDK